MDKGVAMGILIECLFLFTFVADGRLFGVAEGAGQEQALPGACGGQHVLHRAAQVSHVRPISRSLPKSTDLYE